MGLMCADSSSGSFRSGRRYRCHGFHQRRFVRRSASIAAARCASSSAFDGSITVSRRRRSLRHEIKRVQRQLGIPTIYVTHDEEDALALADRVAVLEAGRLEHVGSPADVLRELEMESAARFPALAAGAAESRTLTLEPSVARG